MNRKRDAQKEITSLQEAIGKLQGGKFRVRSMFKSEAGKKEQANQKQQVMDQLQEDVDQYDNLHHYLSVYLATVAIPNYKKQRIEAYVRAMGRMADTEVRNAEITYDCWSIWQKKVLSYGIKH